LGLVGRGFIAFSLDIVFFFFCCCSYSCVGVASDLLLTKLS
jgi:hypothetical protein